MNIYTTWRDNAITICLFEILLALTLKDGVMLLVFGNTLFQAFSRRRESFYEMDPWTDTFIPPTPLSFSQQLTPPHSGKLPAVTHVLLFQTAVKMMSCQCIVAGQVSAKNPNGILLVLSWFAKEIKSINSIPTLKKIRAQC